jgi:hypothetical protein
MAATKTRNAFVTESHTGDDEWRELEQVMHALAERYLHER